MSDYDDLDDLFTNLSPREIVRPATVVWKDPEAEDFLDFVAKNEENSPEKLWKPWMQDKKLELGTIDNLASIMDACIESGRYAIDLETTGLDNRVKEINGRFCTVDQIAGVCLSPDGVRGYYIPLHHVQLDKGIRIERPCNVPIAVFDREFRRLIQATGEGKTVAVFHNGKFDQEFLQFNETGNPWGEWDRPSIWDDTMIAAYMRNTRARRKGLKALSEAPTDAKSDHVCGGPGLGMEMIEIYQLWGHKTMQHGFAYDFALLDPSSGPPLWYGCSDAICTWLLHPVVVTPVVEKDTDGRSQAAIYKIEKVCVAATRWMERNRIHVNREKVSELVTLGQQEWLDSILDVYKEASKILGRDVMPDLYKEVQRNFVADDPRNLLRAQIEKADNFTKRNPMLPSIAKDGKTWPAVYDINSQQQIGTMFDEMRIPGLKRTEKSGQVKTSKDELTRIIEEAGDQFPFMGKIRRFREVAKALSTYLEPMLLDSDPDDDLMRISFNGHKVDTGRYCTPAKESAGDREKGRMVGWPSLNVQATPSTYDPKRPACMNRLRECYSVRPASRYILPDGSSAYIQKGVPLPEGAKPIPKFMAACDYSGVELRLATNISLEPKWLTEFFHCSNCDRTFDRTPRSGLEFKTLTPLPPPPRCPNCGSDEIGDLHTLTAVAIYGQDAINRPDWKALRGHGKCVHPDTLVCMDEGLRPIHTTVTAKAAETFAPCATSIQVQGAKGLVPVRETFYGGEKELFHVVTRRGIVTCTAEHGFLLPDGTCRTISEGLAKGTELGDVPSVRIQDGAWPVIQYRPTEDVPPVIIPLSEELAYWAGLFLGDGCKEGTTSVSFSHGHVSKLDPYGNSYSEWQKILLDSSTKVGLRPIPRKMKIYLGCRSVMHFLSALSLIAGVDGGRVLRIPNWILQAGPRAILPFLAGLFDTDSYVGARDGNIRWCSKDALFAGQVAAVLQAMGFLPSVSPSWNKTYQRFYYIVGVKGSQAAKFKQYMRYAGKVARIPTECKAHWQINKVIEVIPAGKGLCMDLSLACEDHLYWTNGLITHNSTNFALSYGGSGQAVCRSTGVDKNEGARIKTQFDNTYFGLKKWWLGQHKYAKQYGYVRTAFDRKYPVPDIYSTEGAFRAKAERNSVNGPIQGSSADITKTAMALIYKECKRRGWLDKVQMNITMHDELVFEIDADVMEEAIQVIKALMVDNDYLMIKSWLVPLTTDVEVGFDWTVPWDLNAMAYGEVRFHNGKEYKDPSKLPEGLVWDSLPSWPEELRPWFKAAHGETWEPTTEVSAPSVPLPTMPVPPTSGTEVVQAAPTPSVPAGGEYYYRLTGPLSVRAALLLTEAIVQSMSKGTSPLHIVSENGLEITGWQETLGVSVVRVNPLQFETLVQYLFKSRMV